MRRASIRINAPGHACGEGLAARSGSRGTLLGRIVNKSDARTNYDHCHDQGQHDGDNYDWYLYHHQRRSDMT